MKKEKITSDNLIAYILYPIIFVYAMLHNLVYKPVHNYLERLRCEDYVGEHEKWMKKQKGILQRK
jgi:hypothetical protein